MPRERFTNEQIAYALRQDRPARNVGSIQRFGSPGNGSPERHGLAGTDISLSFPRRGERASGSP